MTIFHAELLVRSAGLLQLCVAAANFPAAKLFDYRENLRRVSPFVREVFIVQNVFIVLTVVAMALLCVFLPRELLNESILPRYLCGFFSIFWTLRLFIQLFFYDADAKRRFALMNRFFTLVFVFLATLFGLIALGVMR